MENDNLKVIILVIPFWGHINPISGLAYELAKQKNCKIIFYGNEEHKAIIQATGSEFRCYKNFPINEISRKSNDPTYRYLFLNTFIEYSLAITIQLLPDLINMIDHEKPDLVVYDSFSVHAKYLLKYFTNHRSIKIPSIEFSPTFKFQEGVYPNQIERSFMVKKTNFLSLFYLLKTYARQMQLALKYGFKFENPMNIFYHFKSDLNLIASFPELHPRSHLYNETKVFVGCCMSENVRQVQSVHISKELAVLLDMFEEVNPLKLDVENYFLSDEEFNKNLSKLKLIYVSLGTFFNNSTETFDKIINAIKTFDEHTEYTKEISKKYPQLNSANIRVVIACGNGIYDFYEKKVKNGELVLPSNCLLLKTAPQIDVLKRASLYITHCGMNSTSEAISYGVPVVAMPILADQPRIAYRITDELGFGVRLAHFETNFIKNAMYKVLTDKSFYERIIRYSKISRMYDGAKNSARYTVEFIRKIKSNKI